MFRKITAILLLLIFSIQNYGQTIIMLDYYLNTASFAKDCENKAEPILQCNGKCQMVKKMREQEKKEQQSPERKINNKHEVMSSKSFFAASALYQIDNSQSLYSYLKISISPGVLSDIFHPPALV